MLAFPVARTLADPEIKALIPEERDALLAAARELGPVQYAALRYTWECCNRVTETLHGRIEHIRSGQLWVRVLRIKGKKPKRCDVRITEALLGALDPVVRGRKSGLIFRGDAQCGRTPKAGCPAGHVSARTVRRWMEAAGVAAGIHPGLRHPHTLRHTGLTDLARDMAEAGATATAILARLKKVSGHERMETLLIYLDDPVMHRQTVNAIRAKRELVP